MAAIKVFVKRPFLISSCNGPSFKNDTKTKIFSRTALKRETEKKSEQASTFLLFSGQGSTYWWLLLFQYHLGWRYLAFNILNLPYLEPVLFHLPTPTHFYFILNTTIQFGHMKIVTWWHDVKNSLRNSFERISSQ